MIYPSSKKILALTLLALVNGNSIYAQMPLATLSVSPNGSDANVGSESAPFRTIHKAASAAKPGQTVQIHSGIYRESVSVTTPGVTLQSYAGETSPAVNGADLVTGWTRVSGNIYSAHVDAAVSQVFAGQDRLLNARFPATGFLKMNQSAPSHSVLSSAGLGALLGANEVAGATVHVRTNNWTIEDAQVSSANGDVIGLDHATKFEAAQGFGFYLENKLWMLTSPGTWVYDSASGTLYVWLKDSSSPASHTIEASVRNGIDVNASQITIRGISVLKASHNAILVEASAKNTSVVQNQVMDSGGTGIIAVATEQVTLSGNTIARTVTDAIRAQSSTDAIITQNTISDSGTVGSPVNSLAAIAALKSSNARIENNQILRAGYDGITFDRGAQVKNNSVVEPCKVLVDCAAIYTSQDSRDLGPMNAQVIGNFVSGAFGNYDGSANTSAFPAAGIYLDQYSAGVEVTGNIVNGNEHGFYLDNSYQNKITGNTFYGNRTSQLQMDEFILPGIVFNNTVSSNTLVPLNANPAVVLSTKFQSVSFGAFDENRYSTLFSDKIAKEQVGTAGAVLTRKFYTLAQWRAVRDQEMHGSILTQFQFAPFTTTALGSNLVANGSFATDNASWNVWSADQSVSQQWSSSCSGSIPCNTVRASWAGTSILSSSEFSLTANTTYLAGFDASQTAGEESIASAYVRRNGAPYDAFASQEVLPLDSDLTRTQILFVAPETTTHGRLDLEISSGASIQFTRASVTAVNAVMEDAAVDTKLLSNATEQPVAVNCPDVAPINHCSEYVDLKGQAVSFPLTVAARSAQVVLWANSPFRK